MKIGILGGTFDPVHSGHLRIAKGAMDALGLDRVMLLPAGDPPHKRRLSAKADRLAMAALAAEDCEGLFVSDMEISRPGMTFTIDTLTALTFEHPDVEWTFIIGADALNSLDGWREFPRIARMCRFAAVRRPGCDEALMRMKIDTLRACYDAHVDVLPIDGPALSSTEIRAMVSENRSLEGAVPEKVADYIRNHGLYLCDFTEPEILEKLKATLTPHRYTHTLGVAETAERLAPKCGVDPHRARLAGLLHDCAKSMPLDEMRALVVASLPDLDDEELETRAILHAPAGMVLAQRDYGVRDRAILSAIRKHTVGSGSMSPMDALIYVSDFIEPGREPFPGLEKARKAAEKDIYKAMCVCADLTEKHVRSRGQKVHPRTLALLDEYAYDMY